MKVAPILSDKLYTKKYASPLKNKLQADTSYRLSFKSDRYDGPSVLDIALTDLQNTIEDEIDPFINKYRGRYRKIGNIGLELQAVTDELKKQSNEYFRTEIIDRKKYKIFDTVKSETDDYATYLMNIKEYEHMKEMADSPVYGSPEIRNKAESLKPLIYGNEAVFSSRKELLNAYKSAISMLDDTAGHLTIKNLPEYEKIKYLNNLYNETVAAIIVLPVNEALHFKTEVENIIKSKEKSTTKLDKAMHLSRQMYSGSLLRSIKYADKNEAEINKFIEENKDYKSRIPDIEEIKAAFNVLYTKRDAMVQNTARKLEVIYNKSTNLPYDREAAKKIIDAQKAANEKLWTLIQEAKTEYIKKQNEKFMSDWA